MSPSSKPMSQDTIMALRAQGFSAREIGKKVGKSRGAVLSHVWRLKNPKVKKSFTKAHRIVPPEVFRQVTMDVFLKYGLTPKSRLVAMYLISVVLGYGPTYTSLVFECVAPNVMRAGQKVEDMRDDPELDQWLDHWEQKNSPSY